MQDVGAAQPVCRDIGGRQEIGGTALRDEGALPCLIDERGQAPTGHILVNGSHADTIGPQRGRQAAAQPVVAEAGDKRGAPARAHEGGRHVGR